MQARFSSNELAFKSGQKLVDYPFSRRHLSLLRSGPIFPGIMLLLACSMHIWVRLSINIFCFPAVYSALSESKKQAIRLSPLQFQLRCFNVLQSKCMPSITGFCLLVLVNTQEQWYTFILLCATWRPLFTKLSGRGNLHTWYWNRLCPLSTELSIHVVCLC